MGGWLFIFSLIVLVKVGKERVPNRAGARVQRKGRPSVGPTGAVLPILDVHGCGPSGTVF